MTDSVLFDLLDKAYFIPLREYIEQYDDYADNWAHERNAQSSVVEESPYV